MSCSVSVDVLGDADVFESLLDEFQELLVALDLQGHSDFPGCLRHKAIERSTRALQGTTRLDLTCRYIITSVAT